MGKKISGAQKRKKKREKEELALEMERLKLGPTKIWTGLVLHHKDVFVSHVIPKLNETDRCFFSDVNSESRGVLAYAGVDVSKLGVNVYECTSISTLEWAWSYTRWGEKSINILKYLVEERKISDGVKRDFMYDAAISTLISDGVKRDFMYDAAMYGQLVCLKYLVEEVKVPLDNWPFIACARYFEHTECLNYLLEKGCPEPTDEEYARFVKVTEAEMRAREAAS